VTDSEGDSVNCIKFAQQRIQWRASVNTVIKRLVPQMLASTCVASRDSHTGHCLVSRGLSLEM
jgi:hypothetical protein